ncbi:MAG TPA: MlaD family protein [Solirubrobacteraceae bacterium]|jgi:ABC-type transporter Mla subunit MlaD|nr:MlaD family protein [Solirubrobacteraceae bacterium]
MKRIVASLVVLAGGALFWVFAAGAGTTNSHPTYWVELDNAFGLVSGADVKVAGVRAGKISSFKLDRTTYRALVGVQVDQKGFDQFRTDAFCESLPQSLIGEYFLDCQPGANGQPLKSGAVIPVKQTASTVAPDLVNNILRLPYRQRLRIILNELGAAVAGNETNLNDAIRRGVPALRETDRVLALLAQENQTLADLAQKGDAVITPLARNHAQVGRWVQMAGRTATASAERRAQIAQTFHKFPAFLTELRSNMAALGKVATSQTPALQNLNASSGQLKRFFNDLGPFADASRPAFRALGQASVTGNQALKAAGPTIAELNRFTAQAPEVGKNLAVVLQHLDDPRNAVETDQRAKPQHPDGRASYTGLESLLQWVFDQSMAINVFDGEHYILKVNAFNDPNCAPYTDAATADKGGFALYQECSGNTIGPVSPGLYGQRDICDTGKCPARAPTTSLSRSRRPRASAKFVPRPLPKGAGGPAPAAPPGASSPSHPLALPKLTNVLPGVGELPSVPIVGQLLGSKTGSPSSSDSSGSSASSSSVLGYLLGP